MPADIDVLVSRGSPISFSTNYLKTTNHDELSSILTTPDKISPRTSPLNIASAFASATYLSQSPPNFTSSPPTHYTFHGRCSSPTLLPLPSSLVRTFTNNLRLNSSSKNNNNRMPVAVPRRPCLVVRCDEPSLTTADSLDPPSPNKHKKRVVFADDRGFSLTQVSHSFV
jgi:hypothetical protein